MYLRTMHLNILNHQQHELLPVIRRFKRSFYLVGGTAIAFHIGEPIPDDTIRAGLIDMATHIFDAPLQGANGI